MTSRPAPTARPVTLAAVLVVFSAAVSAGIHAGLVPEHLAEMPVLGISFILAAAALTGAGAAVALRPQAQRPVSLAALLFATLVLAYVASRTTGLPVLEPDPEALDAIGAVTVLVQLVGTLAALWLTREIPRRQAGNDGTLWLPIPHRLGTLSLAGLVAIGFTLLALNGVGSGEGHEHEVDAVHHHDDAPAMIEEMPGME